MDVENFGIRALGQQGIANRVHQVGFSQTHATIDEQRVVQMAWRIGDMGGRSSCHAVGRTFHQGVKGECGIEP